MKEWYVYVNGKCVGTVFEKTEEYARLAAFHKFDIPEDAEISVNRVR
jgi:hypothetical protein